MRDRGSPLCAFCGERSGRHDGFSTSPEAVPLMKNGGGYDPDAFVGKASVYLCRDCSPVAERMATEYHTSPVTECDATAVNLDRKDTWAALAEQSGQDEFDAGPVRLKELFTDAVVTLATVIDEGPRYINSIDIRDAKYTVLTGNEVGMIRRTDAEALVDDATAAEEAADE